MNAHMRRKLAKLELIRKSQQRPAVQEIKKEELVKAAPAPVVEPVVEPAVEPVVEPVVVEEIKVVEEIPAAPVVVEEVKVVEKAPAPAPVVSSGKKKKNV